MVVDTAFRDELIIGDLGGPELEEVLYPFGQASEYASVNAYYTIGSHGC
ncbi:hypothetical protein ES708_24167 [subsurface metagenome]